MHGPRGPGPCPLFLKDTFLVFQAVLGVSIVVICVAVLGGAGLLCRLP